MKKPVIALAYAPLIPEEKYKRYASIIHRAGGTTVRLPLIKAGMLRYGEDDKIDESQLSEPGMLQPEFAEIIKSRDFSGCGIEQLLDGVDGVYIPGGNDVSPALLKNREPVMNDGEKIEIERDVSDYLLAAYCIEKDIPLLAICRGEQILGVVEGCSLVQEMGTRYSREVAEAHRMPKECEKRDYVRGDVYITEQDSVIGSVAGAEVIRNVALWHHQCLGSAEGSALRVTAVTRVGNTEIIQAVERPDLRFCVGLQFHPEIDCGADLDTTEKIRCDEAICLGFFERFVEAAAQ